jgi:MinD-like ATPase involved in chromosome partitioning or flagellar assembly
MGIREDQIGERGVVSLLMTLDQQAEVDFVQHLLPVPNSDTLFLIPAGVPNADYARRLRFIRPELWYREEHNPLHAFLDGLREKLPFKPDVILLDAHTGFSEMSAPLLFDLSDLAVVVFFPHPQAKRGTERLIQGLLSSKSNQTRRGVHFTPVVRFLISPIPDIQIPEVVKRYRNRPLAWIDAWIETLNQTRGPEGKEPFLATEMAHFIPYNASVATSDTANVDDLTSPYRRIADWVVQLLPEPDIQTDLRKKPTKKTILDAFSFSTGIAEVQERLLDQSAKM